MRQIIYIISLVIFTMLTTACRQNIKQKHMTKTYTNHLKNETSPYLLMHVHNPVDWYPWGEEALEKAKEENKLLIISIGYAACHWCHVMEHESFSDSTVAHVMNDNFVSIKIDREERPDIDQIYMNAAFITTGQGGWPLNVVALPDGRPVFAGTYFKKEQWINILSQIRQMQRSEPDKLQKYAEGITNGIRKIEAISLVQNDKVFKQEELTRLVTNWKSSFDNLWGGTKGSPKFPMPIEYEFLMHYFHESNDHEVLGYISHSLKKMAWGGIYDHLAGGFARYSVDSHWKVPHFEKMLYDQGQLIEVYSKAWRITQNDIFKEVVYQTIDFLQQELQDESGLFYSSLDADSEGVEGKFYIWSEQEIVDILGDDAIPFIATYGITERGNWEHGNNVLFQTKPFEEIAKTTNLSVEDLHKSLAISKVKLLKHRNSRVRPALDDKILASWNALTISGLCEAYQSFGEDRFLELAINAIEAIETNLLTNNGRLNRNFKSGKASINAFLDDYATLIKAYMQVYKVTFNQEMLLKANRMVKYVMDHFYDKQSGMFFYTSDEDPELIARKMELSDNVIPSSNSIMANNLYLLGKYLDITSYEDMAIQMVKNMEESMSKGGKYYANWARLKQYLINPPYELVITGENATTEALQISKNYHPDVIIIAAESQGNLSLTLDKDFDKLTFYLCQNKACQLPVHSREKVLEQLEVMRNR
ncbi:thioredoxin domain-containing protein [Puteibacter caeruleilacunae]|nr:thioredoxin domain-containing protein [Puteibacter caeruleilacunae]